MTTIAILLLTIALAVAVWIIVELARTLLAQDDLITAQRERATALTAAVQRQVELFDAQLAYIAELEARNALLERAARAKLLLYATTQPVMRGPAGEIGMN